MEGEFAVELSYCSRGRNVSPAFFSLDIQPESGFRAWLSCSLRPRREKADESMSLHEACDVDMKWIYPCMHLHTQCHVQKHWEHKSPSPEARNVLFNRWTLAKPLVNLRPTTYPAVHLWIGTHFLIGCKEERLYLCTCPLSVFLYWDEGTWTSIC